ncbi:MAG: aspartate/glutamate racemase family protein [Pseudomonadota bacterium]
MRIALIHATPLAMEPVADALLRLWPAAEPMHLLDDRLSVDRARGVPVAETDRRIMALAVYAREAGADGVLFTCSAFGPAIEAAANTLDCPVLRPNEAMFRDAIAIGGPIGLLASFEPSIPPMAQEFAEITDIELRTDCAPNAMIALSAGDGPAHDEALAVVAEGLSGCTAVMLAQFSTARARDAVQARVNLPVLTSPDSAVLAMKAKLD